MSQQKVDYHKEQKRNRRQIMKKEKAMRRLEITILIVVLAALLVWFGYLVYRNAKAKNAASGANTIEMNLGPWENFTQNLDTLIHGEETAETEETAVEETAVEETAVEETAAEETAETVVEEETAVGEPVETEEAAETKDAAAEAESEAPAEEEAAGSTSESTAE